MSDQDPRKGTILASSPSEGFMSPQYRRPAPRPHSIFDDGGDDRWREDWEPLSRVERAHYRRLRGY